MDRRYKPIEYTSMSPYLVVDGADATIDFLKAVFDATDLRRYLRGDGSVMHAELRIDDTVLMLSDPNPPGWPVTPAHVHVYVRDVDATFRKALEAGAVPIQEPIQKDDADRRAGVRDSGGTTWWIATQVG
ncbi:VOC family protein [Tibeticola sp.]|uniref:VOC family protein n=1 Tax=Tibeticola sp. TaxID=2005368 RepID=UPI0025D83D18|nr:VOC family protein [Tibeticola sp.]